LSNDEIDTRPNALEVKIVKNKPAEAVEFWLNTHRDTDAQVAAGVRLFDPSVAAFPLRS